MPIFKLALSSVRREPLRSCITFICVCLSSALLASICSFCVALLRATEKDDPDYIYYVGVCGILVGIVAIIAAIIIRAVFTVSFNERVNLLGLLATVGMTNGGKACLVFAETAFYGIFGSLAGTGLGYMISRWYEGVVNSQIHRQLFELYGENYMEKVDYEEAFYIFEMPIEVIAISVFVSLATVILASVKPMRRASRLSIIDSLKADVRINISLSEGLAEKIMCKFFGRMGRLAGQNFDNNAPRYRAVSMTLSASSILFINIYALLMWQNWEDGIYTPFDDPLMTVMLTLGFALTFIALIGAFCSAITNINSRTREFAILKSLGMSNGNMFKLMCFESTYIFLHTALYSIIACYASVYCQFQLLWMAWEVHYFYFPWGVWSIFLGIDIIFCILFAVCAVLKIRKVNIAAAIK